MQCFYYCNIVVLRFITSNLLDIQFIRLIKQSELSDIPRISSSISFNCMASIINASFRASYVAIRYSIEKMYREKVCTERASFWDARLSSRLNGPAFCWHIPCKNLWALFSCAWYPQRGPWFSQECRFGRAECYKCSNGSDNAANRVDV